MYKFQLIADSFGLQGMVTKSMPDINIAVPVRLSGDEAPVSLLGNPVFDNIIFYDEDSGLELKVDTVLIDVNRPKIIERSVVQGRDGRVKEFIANDDYNVMIRGLLVNPDKGLYPLDDMNTLIALCDLNKEIKVTSDYLNLFGISYIVIANPYFPQRKGHQNTQLFSLNCFSDEAVELIINEESEL